MRLAKSSLGRLGTTAPVFTDVAADHPWRPAIEWAKAQGISNGCETDKFCPERTATRGEVAVFLYRALANPGGGAAATVPNTPEAGAGLTIFGKQVSPWAAGGALLLLLALVARK